MYKKILAPLIACLSGSIQAAQYSIIIDASSRGEHLHLFQYEKNASLPSINDIFSVKNDTDLAVYVDHPSDAGPSLKKLLDAVDIKLSAMHIDKKTVSLNVAGTENMRSFSNEAQDKIYSSISGYVSAHYFFSVADIKTLPRKMEGVYDWLSINYLDGRFKENQPMLGVLKNDALTMEIAYATIDTSKSADEMDLVVDHHRYTIFSKIFSGLGIDQARAAMNGNENCYPSGYSLSPDKTGHFNLSACALNYSAILQKQDVPAQLLPFNHQMFVAFSGVDETFDFFGIEVPDRGAAEARIYYVCADTWENMKKEYEGMPETALSTICANAIYLDQLIFNTYQLQSEQLWITDNINRQKIDWPLGMVLYSLISDRPL